MIKSIAAFTLIFLSILTISFAVHGGADTARNSVNKGNIHQLAAALEFYYYDSGFYTEVSNGSELVGLLVQENYIKQAKIDGSRFSYSVLSNGQNYELTVK